MSTEATQAFAMVAENQILRKRNIQLTAAAGGALNLLLDENLTIEGPDLLEDSKPVQHIIDALREALGVAVAETKEAPIDTGSFKKMVILDGKLVPDEGLAETKEAPDAGPTV
jgi:hypothetical protein